MFRPQQQQKDCDSDDDCYWGLDCFHRTGFQLVPGCLGLGVEGKDYCYKPSKDEYVVAGEKFSFVDENENRIRGYQS